MAAPFGSAENKKRKKPTCRDGKQNGVESDIGCYGTCPRFATNERCAAPGGARRPPSTPSARVISAATATSVATATLFNLILEAWP